MGKKKGKDKRGKGAEKTAVRTEKKAEKKNKKELQDLGEENVEAMIAEFQERDRLKLLVTEEKCAPPSPRSNATLITHPEKKELILFGGEFFNGSKTFVYNDLFIYHIKTKEWTRTETPNPPPPRCAHQAVCVRQGGGQMWMFGGEFASPTQSQFYHYNDFWLLHLKEQKWEKIESPGGPSSRSGHRMAVYNRNILVFGGFHDNVRNYRYFNDLYAYDLDTYSWSKLEPVGTIPSPRSGCQLAVTHEESGGVVLFGGYSKERVKKDVDKGKVHVDMFLLTADKKGADSAVRWRWCVLKQQGVRPSPRCSFSLSVIPGNRAVLFGGVYDENEDEESLSSKFFNDAFILELDRGRWYPIILRGEKSVSEEKRKRRRKPKESPEKECESSSEMSKIESDSEDEQDVLDEIEDKLTFEENDGAQGVSQEVVLDDGIFKVSVGGGPKGCEPDLLTGAVGIRETEYFVPSPRMNAAMVVRDGVMYLYGGMQEDGDRQVTFSDMYSLDLRRLDKWNTLIAGQASEWEDSEDSLSEEEETESDDSEQDMEVDSGQ